MTALPAIEAARAARVPVVCTVRDYWPVCYWSDLIHTRSGLLLCPECTAANMTRCVRPRAGAAWPLALPLIPYMRANLARKQATLADADAVIAVSHRIADDLRARQRLRLAVPELHPRRRVLPGRRHVHGLGDRRRRRGRPPLGSPRLEP